MGDIVTKGLADRQAQVETRLGMLAYTRLGLMRQVEEIDKMIATLEAITQVNGQVKKDLETEAAIEAAKDEKPKKK